MLEITSLDDTGRKFIPDLCDTCENRNEGADKCKINKNGTCNYESQSLAGEPRCHKCAFGVQKDANLDGKRTYDCSVGRPWWDCDKFVAKDIAVPIDKAMPPVHVPEKEHASSKQTTHHIKIRESFANAVHMGIKTFEIRKNDRGYQKGDHVKFTVLYDSDGLEMISHPLHDMTFEITYVLAGWGLQDGYVVFGINPV